VGLAEEGGLVRVEPQGQVVEGRIVRVLAKDFWVLNGGQGVVVGDEVEALRLVLQSDVLLDGAEVVADVQLARRLDAAQDALAHGRLAGHWSGSSLRSQHQVPQSKTGTGAAGFSARCARGSLYVFLVNRMAADKVMDVLVEALRQALAAGREQR